MLDPVETLRALIAIPSVNPMGRQIEGPQLYESRLTDYLQARFEQTGLAWQRQPVAPGRDNILARLDGAPATHAGGELLLWEVHQDTVPVDGMTIDPFRPELRDGRIYGRGACDVKGGMAAMLCALDRLARARPVPRPTIVLACTVNEEFGFSGASALGDLWSPAANSILPRRPDAAIVAEPTGLDVVVAHMGCVRWRCHALGHAAHSCQPERGTNAIYRMGHVVCALEAYQRCVIPSLPAHPRCGSPSVSVGTIIGGTSVNTVPDRATIEIDRRLTPDEDPDQAYQALQAYLANRAVGEGQLQHDPPLTARGLSDRHNGALASRLLAVARRQYPPCRPVGVRFGTDAAVLADAGLPTVVFGPGSIDEAHTADEWLDLDQLHTATNIYYELACGNR
ncbi:MAG: hypothetical protein A2W31_02630 [Planctomycetes bacterium RBG_16_64_10]|nr:MAG: hypothetical protein A2W31_02630 [Planctomycetes bacterium RBG_16_64_10]